MSTWVWRDAQGGEKSRSVQETPTLSVGAQTHVTRRAACYAVHGLWKLVVL